VAWRMWAREVVRSMLRLFGLRQIRDKQVICYRQVHSYIHVTLPTKPRLKTDHESTAILALVTLCKTNGEDVSWVLVWYHKMELVRAFDVVTIDCVIGRVKVSDRWGIIDRSLGTERAVMHGMWEPEYESEDEND
jgi:hypothetical protein